MEQNPPIKGIMKTSPYPVGVIIVGKIKTTGLEHTCGCVFLLSK
jgi:hypothetical protein